MKIRLASFVLLTICLTTGRVSSTAAQVPVQDSLALVALYNATDGTNWTDNTGWLTGPVGTWFGVTAFGGSVHGVNLKDNNLIGSLPAEIGDFTQLVGLRMAQNNITGGIPSEIGNLGNLQFLDLSGNNLTGSIPVEIGQLLQLKELSLAFNQLTGPIPTVLGNLTDLTGLNFWSNSLTGSIPVELGLLTDLRGLDLRTNDLTGPIPPELGDLSLLTYLRLGGNDLSGTIPKELGMLSSLCLGLDLALNQLTGSIPPELGDIACITGISLRSNQLTGAVPASFSNLTSLQVLDVRSNDLTDLPSFASLPLLQLWVGGNRLTFEDLEPNIGIPSFLYTPQESGFGVPAIETVVDGAGITLDIPIGGVNNVYEWRKGGVAIPGAIGPTYSIASASAADGGVYTLVVTNSVVSGLTYSSHPTTLIVVDNVAPTVDTVFTPVDPIEIGDQPLSISAEFSDPGGVADEPYSCSVDYGDGSGPFAGSASGFTCTGPDHSYAAPGIYTVTVTVSDKHGASDESTASTFIVIYDPDGGFVTGGGWIDSPPEACPDFCDGASGKANFGFVSKYKKGQSVPTGETEFNFKAGDLNFHSVSYDWLVVAGPQAKFKGDGTINGEGDYGFMLSAVDAKLTGGGEADKFRIKIWTNDQAEDIVYDNQLGDDDDAGASDEIEGGSIVIHDGKSASKGAISDASAELPERYALHQNYPNPFNPVTNIGFDLPEAGFVRIRVVDMLGREVDRLVGGDLKAGRHTVSFDAGSLPSGVYLFQMDAESFAAVRRMVLLK